MSCKLVSSMEAKFSRKKTAFQWDQIRKDKRDGDLPRRPTWRKQGGDLLTMGGELPQGERRNRKIENGEWQPTGSCHARAYLKEMMTELFFVDDNNEGVGDRISWNPFPGESTLAYRGVRARACWKTFGCWNTIWLTTKRENHRKITKRKRLRQQLAGG